MRQKSNMPNLLPLLFTLLWLVPTCGPAQIEFVQDFEGEEGGLNYTTNVTPYGTGGLPSWNVVTRSRGITAYSGTHFWAVRDADNALSNTPENRLTFDAGTICTLTRARFVFAYQVLGYDGGDDFGYELYLDGLLHERVVVVDGKNGGGVSTDGWQTDTVSIPGTAQTARITFFFDQNGDDVAGLDYVQLLATGTTGNCAPVCGLRLETPSYDCDVLTADPDPLTLRLPYAGAEVGVRVSTTVGTVGGDDPATVQDGVLTVRGLREGQPLQLVARGGDCDLTLDLQPPADQCAASPLVINELLPDPEEDTNQDGVVSAADEFVEIYNTGDVAVDVAGYALFDASNSGARFVFPQGTSLDARERFVVFGGGKPEAMNMSCAFGTARGFLGLNSTRAETVTLRDPAGRVVAQASYEVAPQGESLVLHPAGNLAGGYRTHTSVEAGTTSSPCASAAALPVELLDFTATPLDRAVRLDWSTAAERDNAGFTVERSKAGTDYTPVGYLPAGDGTYVLVDYTPFPGLNYYRLRQRDLDGTETLYGPVTVRLDSGTLELYPNPTQGRLYLTGPVGTDDRYTVYRSDGQAVHAGSGQEINVAHLPAGSYYLRLRWGSGLRAFRFMKK